MKTFSFVLALASLLLAMGCSPAAEQKSAPAAQAEFKLTGSIKDIMDSIVDPSADTLWGSGATTVDAQGMHERFPRTDEEWQEVRRQAIRLMEATNLLVMPGRIVAKPG